MIGPTTAYYLLSYMIAKKHLFFNRKIEKYSGKDFNILFNRSGVDLSVVPAGGQRPFRAKRGGRTAPDSRVFSRPMGYTPGN